MVNDFYNLNCNFLQLPIKWLRQPPFPDKHYFNFNIPQQKKSFECKGFLFLFNIQSCHSIIAGGVRGGGWKKYETSFIFILLHPPSSRAVNNSWSLNSERRHICQDSLVIHKPCMWHKSSTLLHRSPNLPSTCKVEFCAFLCFSLKFSPFFLKTILFINFFDHYMTSVAVNAILQWLNRQILIVCTSCKTLYNVLGHIHVIIWGLGHIVFLRDGPRRGIDVGGTVRVNVICDIISWFVQLKWRPTCRRIYILSESLLAFFGLLFLISLITLISLFFPTSALIDVFYSHKLLVFQVKNQAHQLVVLCKCQLTCQVATQSVKSIRKPSNSLWKRKEKMQEWKQKEGNWWKKE